jgi:hypothetical protein
MGKVSGTDPRYRLLSINNLFLNNRLLSFQEKKRLRNKAKITRKSKPTCADICEILRRTKD